ncbi:MAG: hypothetical protein EBW03_06520 [Rhodobacteraceae bacterium]|nr:hypothetical protein [Paracoccaceae bacterium]
MMPMTKIGKKVQSFVAISALALMTACAPTMPTGPKVDTSKPVPVALLVPQSSDATAQIAADLENAARLAAAAEQGKERAMVIHSDRIDGQMGLNAFQGAAADTNLRIVSAQSFELTQESVVNTVPLIRASAEIEDVDTLFLTSSSAGALPLLAQLLPEAGLDPANVQYVGLTRWDIPPQTLELNGLQGGWFAVPDLTRTENFSTQFQEQFGNRPHQLASLAFDGIAAIGALAQAGFDDILTREALTQPSGFQGVDGIFRLKDDGTNERGLAIATVQDKQVLIIDPAPRSFAITGF